MDNLGPNSEDPNDKRPHQMGAAQQTDDQGNLTNVQKNWLVDTGAKLSCINEDNALNFTLHRIEAATAHGAGGEALPVYDGLTMVFQRVGLNGRPENVSCNLAVAISKSSNILGMDQLASQHCAVDWDTVNLTGRIYEVQAKPKSQG